MKFRLKHLIKLLHKQLGDGVVIDIIDENTEAIYGRVTTGVTDLRWGRFPRETLNKVVGSIAYQPDDRKVTAYVA